MNDRVVRWLASAGGIGLIPVASGTWGTLPAVVLALGLYAICSAPMAGAVLALLAVLVTAGAIPLATAAEKLYGEKDSHKIVIDEVAGFFWTLSFIAPAGLARLAWALIAGFFLFRLFDIWKPFPIRRLQSLPGGWGVVLDDVLAGLYANLVLRGLMHFIN